MVMGWAVANAQVLAVMREHGHRPDPDAVQLVAEGALQRVSTQGVNEVLAMAQPWSKTFSRVLVAVGRRACTAMEGASLTPRYNCSVAQSAQE
jgi:23S rRNA G2445 N2-methylase RlmL